MNGAQKDEIKIFLISFFISPFLTLLLAIYKYRWQASQLFFILSLSFLGYHIGLEGDLNRYHDWFFIIGNQKWSVILYNIIHFKTGDIYTTLLSKIIYDLTKNVHLYFAILMGIYAYFYTSVIKVMLSRLHVDNNKVVLLFIGFATFFFVREFISIRFSTALLMSSYALLEIVLNNKKKFIILFLCAPLIHIGFLVVLPIPFIYYILKNKTNACIFIVIISFFFSQGDLTTFFGNIAIEHENTIISSKVSNYASDEGIEYLSERYQRSKNNANIKLKTLNSFIDIVYIACMAASIIIMIKRKKILYDLKQKQLFNLSLLLWSFANIMKNISNGIRFMNLWVLVLLALMVLIQQNNPKDRIWQVFIYLFIPVLLFKNFINLIAANPLFKLDFFISNYIVDMLL